MSDTDPIRLNYLLTPAIYNEAVALFSGNSATTTVSGMPSLYRYGVFIAIGLAIRIGLRMSLRSADIHLDASHDIAFVLGAVVIVAIFRFGLRRKLLGGAPPVNFGGAVQEQIKAGFNSDGLRIISDRGQATYPWSGILEIKTGPNCVALWTGTNTIAVPNSALPDTLNPQGFCDQLDHWRTA